MHNICSVRPTPRLAPRRCSSSATSLIVSLLVTALTDLFIANFSACSPADNYLGNYVTVAVPSVNVPENAPFVIVAQAPLKQN